MSPRSGLSGRRLKILKVPGLCVLSALTLFAISACGSTDSSKSTSAKSKGSTSPKVVAKEAGIGKPTNLRVVNRSGRNITIDICHDGYCIGNKTLKDGESDQAAGGNINGWVKYDWGMGNGWQQNQYTGELGNAAGPYQIDFKAGNPDIGLPWIEARLPNSCGYHTSSQYGGGNDNPARWALGVGGKSQSPENSLCTYSMVASRADDGGTDRVTGAAADYKMLTLEAYAPISGVASNGCTWEPTPGPVIRPQSPDGSWSCWAPGPKPPAGTPVTTDRVGP